MTENPVECISSGNVILAYVVRATYKVDRTTFVTPDTFKQQLGFVVYQKGTTIPRHRHLPLERKLVGTSEVLIVRQGSCSAQLYDDNQTLVTEIRLEQGDVIVLAAGGHGFTAHEDLVLMEVKQGPYTGLVEKEKF